MANTHCHTPPAKRIKVQSDINPQPKWLLIPKASRTVQDLVKSLLVRLELPDSFSYDLCLDGAPILPNEDVALVRDGEQLHLRQREPPSPLPLRPNPLHQPQHLSMSSAPEDTQCDAHRKRKRVLTPEGKRRRNARNRKREKRRRLQRRELPDNHQPDVADSQQHGHESHIKVTGSHLDPPNEATNGVKPCAPNEHEAPEQNENPLSATRNTENEQQNSVDITQPSNKHANTNGNITGSEHNTEKNVLITAASEKSTDGALPKLHNSECITDENSAEGVQPEVVVHNAECIRDEKSTDGVHPEVHDSERNKDGEVTVNISFTNDVADEHGPIAGPAVGDVQHGPDLPRNDQMPSQSLDESEHISGGRDNRKSTVDSLDNPNPRWKRQRPQGKHNTQKQTSSPSAPTSSTDNMEDTHREGPSVIRDAPYRLEERDNPGSGTDRLPQVGIGETTTPPIDVINLIEVEEDCTRAIGRFHGPHKSRSTNSSKSSSPQSIVVSPVEPAETVLATVKICKEVSRKELDAGASTGTSNKHMDPVQQIQKTTTDNPAPVHASRRKQISPVRLSKPNANVNLNKVTGTDNVTSQDEHGTDKLPDGPEKLPEGPNALENLVVTDGRENAIKERKELQTKIRGGGQYDTRLGSADSVPAQGTHEAVGMAIEPEISQLIPKDKKRKPSCLKGGMSTLDALRVARAHQARKELAEKRREGVDPQNDPEALLTCTDNMETERPKSDLNEKQAGGKSRKKSKRSKRSKTTMRYLNEQQINKSTFVGHRPETMLPPLELLDLPDGANELKQTVDVPVTLLDTPRPPPEKSRDEQMDTVIVSAPHREGEGTPSSATAPTNTALANEIQIESAGEDTEHPAEPRSSVGNPSSQSYNQPEEQAHDQRRSGTNRESLSHNTSERVGTAAVNSPSPQFGTGDNFRGDLFETLRHTSKTLAEVWAKWDNC